MATDFDTCFKTGDERRTVGEALARFESSLGPVATVERIATRDALGRILAQDLASPRDVPPHDNSAVDGYAVWFDDLDPAKPTTLPVAARIAAGHPSHTPVARGAAVQIFTGAPMPPGLDGQGPDTIVMVEDCEATGDRVVIQPGIKRGANRRSAGEDVHIGDIKLTQGMRLRPQDVGMAAAMGFPELPVYRKLRAAVFSTGDEVREPGTALDEGCIFDTNRYALMGMLERLGCAVTDLGILPDSAELIRAELAEAARDHDLIVTSGGVSRGEEDHVRAGVAALGGVHFWNLAIKPGRPIALGHIKTADGQTPFIGLPGNPVAVMVTFLRIARPIVLALAGGRAAEQPAFKVAAGFDFKKKPGRREWLRAALVRANGGLIADKFPDEGSGILTSMVTADGLVELPEDNAGVKRGDLIDFLPFAGMME
jgi:molybdopterin molybdotransferase